MTVRPAKPQLFYSEEIKQDLVNGKTNYGLGYGKTASDDADSHYQPFNDRGDADIKKKEVNLNEDAAAVKREFSINRVRFPCDRLTNFLPCIFTAATVRRFHQSSSPSSSSGEEEAVHEDFEFDKLTDIVLSLKDEAYGSIVRPHVQQMLKERNVASEDVRSRATAIFDALRKRLKSTGGNFYRGRNNNLKGDGFLDTANLYLVEDEDEVVTSESYAVTIKSEYIPQLFSQKSSRTLSSAKPDSAENSNAASAHRRRLSSPHTPVKNSSQMRSCKTRQAGAKNAMQVLSNLKSPRLVPRDLEGMMASTRRTG